MKLKLFVLLLGILLLGTDSLFSAGLRDHLEGLVYEVEDYTEPKDAWTVDQAYKDKWRLWTKEENVIQKRSNGASLVSPSIKKDRKTPEDGAPVLHTKITEIPNGIYEVFTNSNGRPIALSFDGRKWFPFSKQNSLGIFQITNGTFELWADDRYACPENIGPVYYDYIRFVKTEKPKLTDLTAFTLPDGSTQISWISSCPMPPVLISYGAEGQIDKKIVESETGLRNHFVILKDLKKDSKYNVNISFQNEIEQSLSLADFEFTAGFRPEPSATSPQKIRLEVAEPTDKARSNWPVTSGVPFAQGKLASASDVSITDEQGRVVPAQFAVTSKWLDGSVKWLTCDFTAETKPNKPSIYWLVTGKKKIRTDNTTAKQLEDQARSILDQSVSTIVLADGRSLTNKTNKKTKPVIETSGSVRVSIKAEGDYFDKDQKPFFHWRCHVTAYPFGLSRIRWTIGNNQIDKITTSIRSADWGLNGDKKFKKPTMTDGRSAKSELTVFQDLEKHSVVTIDGKKSENEKLNGFFLCGDTAIKASNFWETWPKGFEFKKEYFRFNILPELSNTNYPPKNWETPMELFCHFYWYDKENRSYKFKRGMELCSEIWLVSDSKIISDGRQLNAWLEHPLFAVASSEYYCQTKAFGNINPRRAGKFDSYEKTFELSFALLESGRVSRGEYGWMNFGDWFGERHWNWGNNEYDLSYLMAIQFARTGNLAYIKRGTEMANHYTTIDFCSWPWKKNTRELVYAHSTGHVGGFIEKGDPRIPDKEKFVANLQGGQDGSGGHAFHPGNYFIGNLTGDLRILEVAQIACRNQAMRFTPAYKISIERAAGWALSNAVYSYNFTNNPYYLNAAKLYYEAIVKTQNPKTGCFDLPQDLSECDCPDKKEHRGGKAFAVGVLLHSLARYYETTNDPQVKQTITRCADWLLDYSWNEKKKGFRYKTGCPKYENSGRYSIIVSEGIAYATEVSGNPRYIDFLDKTVGPHLIVPQGSGIGSGKSFTQYQRHLPHLLYYLEKNNRTAGVK